MYGSRAGILINFAAEYMLIYAFEFVVKYRQALEDAESTTNSLQHPV